MKFWEIDVSGDGRVSLEILKRALPDNPNLYQQFRNLDKDGDGFLSKSELNNTDGVAFLHAASQIRFRFGQVTWHWL